LAESGGRGQRNRSRNSQRQERSRGGAPHIERVAVIERTRWSRWSARLSRRAARCSISLRVPANWQDAAASR